MLLAAVFLLVGVCVLDGAELRFQEHSIATGLKGGYQVVVADMNHDGRPDLIAVASGMSDLVWFENPTWERHVIAGGFTGMINVAALDLNGDGIPELVLAHGFSSDARKSAGILTLLEHDGDPRRPWKATEIDRLPASHRLRWADFDGSGNKVLVNAPLTNERASPPDYAGNTPLFFYRPGSWKREQIPSSNAGITHGIYVTDWDRNGRDDIFTAGFTGIHLYRLSRSKAWSEAKLAAGDPSLCPRCGSSDVSAGKLRQERFLAAIEPWHGNQVVIYRRRANRWARQVIDTMLQDGHTILTADLDGDGRDEVIAGYRGTGHSVYIYHAVGRRGGKWNRSSLDDGGMGAAACAVADLNADKKVDIVCIGSATANLKWYENLGGR